MSGRHAAEPSAGSVPRLLGPAEIRDLASLLEVTPTKKLGQNFVHDANTVRRIVKLAGVRPGETVVEVGPGLGSLTLGLLEAGARVVAVEIDRRLAEQLPLTVELMAPGADLAVVQADAMKILDVPGDPVRLVANLPYNISVPVLLHFLEHFASIRSGVVMVQSEVGHRLAAGPGSKVYGGPSVKAAWFGSWSTGGTVSRQIFWPVPHVDSVLVSFERHEEPGDETLRRAVFAVVDAAFAQRRKMLRQSLAALFGDSAAAIAALESAGVAQTARGEELDVAAFVRLGRTLDPERVPVRGAAVPEGSLAASDGRLAGTDGGFDDAEAGALSDADRRASTTL
ncbi:16S rRNA (adenine1518-N6/adenine1519-N6)-dimethyltransferase [Rathayibacter tanaceti]|uniref:Ribosomal RNA small subunit methyltransferase A n=2 Tax=Rathayibacter tanaceti TaxID=1671680 RepID=A0A166HJK4_9MICO|nr:16S rRNA (adenine(1518)-N(6)/adenine(1519)-N(6))-dimethyltransferase RsmA [Rathayibacter tanaceti]KZX20712.1 Ribosomal RNA small subunit methyltransferase A [Rathayibacter tanaceti]QHC54981.1 16S rRNA (adenine(1518)-N(6)/adenine(1519)-N(6))-dimethyltransferase RsmA [Rathayibacter tanaceti]TCO38526.1 16S rRNA (adenine1518-N6/adenine1519-N6)-dimethyltransferase [Rathayibacter tanaceti]